jgi:hypothetical protein
MRILGIVALCAALGGCSVTVPVAVISKDGQVLRGTTTASLSGGTFQATDGKLTCSGTYDSLSQSVTINAKVLCSDGRTGFVIATRDSRWPEQVRPYPHDRRNGSRLRVRQLGRGFLV